MATDAEDGGTKTLMIYSELSGLSKGWTLRIYLLLLPAAAAVGCSMQAQLFLNKASLRRSEPKHSSDMGLDRRELW